MIGPGPSAATVSRSCFLGTKPSRAQSRSGLDGRRASRHRRPAAPQSGSRAWSGHRSSHGSVSVAESIALACDQICADVATPPVVAVASVSAYEARRDAGARILEMLESLGAEVPRVEDDSIAWPIVLRAFGFCDLALVDFFGPFLSRLPAWHEQDGLERSLNLLLDELDHAGEPQARAVVAARMRAAVRDAMG
jgi:hypothetical protein